MVQLPPLTVVKRKVELLSGPQGDGFANAKGCDKAGKTSPVDADPPGCPRDTSSANRDDTRSDDARVKQYILASKGLPEDNGNTTTEDKANVPHLSGVTSIGFLDIVTPIEGPRSGKTIRIRAHLLARACAHLAWGHRPLKQLYHPDYGG